MHVELSSISSAESFEEKNVLEHPESEDKGYVLAARDDFHDNEHIMNGGFDEGNGNGSLVADPRVSSLLTFHASSELVF